MKTWQEVRDIVGEDDRRYCSSNEEEAIDRFYERVKWAWENWEDDLTKEFWGGDIKPSEPTNSFEKDYYINENWDEFYGDLIEE